MQASTTAHLNTFQQLQQHYSAVRALSESHCKPLVIEDYVVQPITDVSPPKWHLGHTTWFFETFVLKNFEPDYKPVHELYSFLLNSYYHHIGERWERVDRGKISRPTVEEMYAYRRAVDERVNRLLENYSGPNSQELETLLTLGLHHEQQHQELLLTDIKYILCLNPIRPIYNNKHPLPSGELLPETWISIKGGMTEVGTNETGFHYDNEGPKHQTFIQDFKVQNRLVTNREYLAFIQDGAYSDFRHWLSDGWQWVQIQKARAPLYWLQKDDVWFEVTLRGQRELDLDAPVTHVNYYETEAYASWRNKRLLTEFEWEHLCKKHQPRPENGNFVDDAFYHPLPATKNGEQITQLFGDVWEWTQSAYLPYPGYRQAPGAIGEYNGKFMVNQYVLRGGSCATPAGHVRATYRNFFPASACWQFSGVRLARDGVAA